MRRPSPTSKAKNRPSGKRSRPIRVDARPRADYSSRVALLRRQLEDAPDGPMPSGIKPMLATLVDQPFTDEGWQFELKLDGYRALAYLEKGKAGLYSRNNLPFHEKFAPITEALRAWAIDAVVDGEVVVLNESGRPDFNDIQQWEKKKGGQLVYYVFDLLWLDGKDLTGLPLYRRREVLKELVPSEGAIRFSDHIDDLGESFYELARNNGLEGIVAKKKDSLYTPDSRSKHWLKIKVEERHEAVICGFTRKADSDRVFSSLVLGIYKNGVLTSIGQVGTGFTAESSATLMRKMKPKITRNCPFATEPPTNGQPTWLKPFLVCEVKYTELTPEGVMRHPSFQGLRDDKTAADLNTEEAAPTEELLEEQAWLDPKVAKASLEVEGQNLQFTNLQKIFWPKEGYTKGDLLRYYLAIADHLLPYMLDRPQSLNRYPDGIEGPSFYHKNMGKSKETWLHTFRRFSESNGEPKDFLICNGEASLLYMVNLGCIEMNPWHSRWKTAAYPDWSVIDLDPGDKIGFNQVIETAQVVQQLLNSLGLPSFPKTSGSTGLHIYVPLGGRYQYEQSRQFAELIARLVHEELPGITSIERDPKKRVDKIYIDYLQNRPIQTICAPYCVRPKPGATVSAPLHWSEVKKGLRIGQFTMKNIFERLRTEGDLFRGVLGNGIDLNKMLKALASLI